MKIIQMTGDMPPCCCGNAPPRGGDCCTCDKLPNSLTLVFHRVSGACQGWPADGDQLELVYQGISTDDYGVGCSPGTRGWKATTPCGDKFVLCCNPFNQVQTTVDPNVVAIAVQGWWCDPVNEQIGDIFCNEATGEINGSIGSAENPLSVGVGCCCESPGAFWWEIRGRCR